jgi:hypothetical protein
MAAGSLPTAERSIVAISPAVLAIIHWLVPGTIPTDVNSCLAVAIELRLRDGIRINFDV